MIGTSLQYLQVAVYWCSIAISTAAIAGRIWARRIMRKRWQANDYLMFVSWVCISVDGSSASARLRLQL
jgi:hypothetical protein